LKRILSLLFLLWAGVIIIVYYVVQKPNLLNAFTGLMDTFWTLFVAGLLFFNSYGIGKRILKIFKIGTQDVIDQLLLSLGIGLGSLGLMGLLFSVLQLADEKILTLFQFALAVFFLFKKDLKSLLTNIHSLVFNLNQSFSRYSIFTKLALLLSVLFSFLLTLVPPFEAFDALLYHLTLPAQILQYGGLLPFDNVPFWFPSLSENVYLWALGMESERAAQIIHFIWMLLSALLLWHWAFKTWNAEVARKTLLLLAAIPSLVMLASWAYADMALVFSAIVALYAFTQYRITQASSWLNIAGVMAGFAMGIKYTSFVLPLSIGLLLLLNRPFLKAFFSAAQFSIVALATASPWYIRNAIFMGNPFYPFLFHGRFWDSFLAEWYADAGTGIGWNPLQIILLPLNTILGSYDITFFDGRIGLLFLLLAPFTIWILWMRIRPGSNEAERWSLITIGLFALLSFTAWTFGVINAEGLWQARFLFPSLFPFAIPTALAWDSLKQFDISKFRISFLINTLIGLVVAITVIDNGIFVIQRNPLAVAVGVQSRERYIERVNPSYAALMSLVDELPAQARLYSILEPRSYGLRRPIQADPLLYNFPHDVYLFRTADEIIAQWKSKQFTHILVYERGVDLMKESIKFTPDAQETLQETLGKLKRIAQTPDQVYSLYEIP
jgi:hypothetical protein